MGTLLLILGLILFLALVVVHELGHFIVARKSGVEVQEFGIGFPPRLFKKRTKGGWLFTVNLLPFGGFVKLKGEHDGDTEPGSLGAASLRAKVAIMVAGVSMNLITAYVLLVVLALIGMPQVIDNQFMIKEDATYVQHARQYIAVGAIEAGSPADKIGVRANDTIVSIGESSLGMTMLSSVDALLLRTREYAGQTVILAYQHGSSGGVVQKTVGLRSMAAVEAAKKAGKQVGYLGVSVYQTQSGISIVRSTWSAPLVAAGLIKQFTVITFEGLGKAIGGIASIIAGGITGNVQARQAGQTEASAQVAGPVGIFFVFKYGSALGYKFILLIVALLSLTLSIMNILPIPALDGGRLWLTLATRALKKPLAPEREEAINAAGFAFLIGIIVLVTIADVRRFF